MSLAELKSALDAGRSDHRTLAEGAYAMLHEAIVTGLLEPDERLPIGDLAGVLRVSPMPVREALRRLESVGLVENIPHRGARVAGLSIEDLTEVYEARLALEALAIRHGAERFTEEARERAEDALRRTVAAQREDRIADAWRAHTDFHFALYHASGSRWLMRLIYPVWESTERYRLAVEPVRRSLDDRSGEHERMLAACARHDQDAAAFELHNHLVRTANVIAQAMGAPRPFRLQPRRRQTAASA
ncbi:MAG: GntR family transcriptional regulator [Solirubrobacteraceae bacterium]